MRRTHKRLIGVVFWLVALVATTVSVVRLSRSPASGSESPPALASITRYLRGQASSIERVDPTSGLRVGDPVFFAHGDDNYRQVGHVSEILDADPTRPSPGDRVTILWYEPAVDPEACQLLQYHSTGRLSEVVKTLLPPERQERIREKISASMAAHGEELSRAFVPLVEDSLRASLPVIEAQFRLAVADHRAELDAAARRWNEQLVRQRLVPMAQREILPIVKEHGQRPAEEMGREIWDRASLFRFGWRAIYDKSPLPRKDLLREEWQRFVEEEAVPVMEKHMDEVVVAIQRSLRDISSNPAIRAELASVAEEVAADPQSRRLVQSILKQTLVDNEALREVWRDVWTSDEANQAFAIASEKLEPVVREIGDEIFGSEADGINPDFARVLRSQILRKDRRWIVAWHTGVNNGIIEPASRPMAYPVVYMAEEESAEQTTAEQTTAEGEFAEE